MLWQLVVTNQMTTRVLQGRRGSQVVPCLGESWGHACTTRLLLEEHPGARTATVIKASSCAPATVPFTITVSLDILWN